MRYANSKLTKLCAFIVVTSTTIYLFYVFDKLTDNIVPEPLYPKPVQEERRAPDNKEVSLINTKHKALENTPSNFTNYQYQELIPKQRVTPAKFADHNTSIKSSASDNNEERGPKIDEWSKVMTERFSRRMKTLTENCLNISHITNKTELFPPKVSYYVPEYKFFACIPAKSGATTWKTHFLKMKGYPWPPLIPHVPWVHNILRTNQVMNGREFIDIMKSPAVTRIMSVRHPVSRLISAYSNKFNNGRFEVPSNTSYRYVKEALKLHGFNLERGAPAKVTFEQFLSFILHEKEEGIHNLNNHWRPQNSLCNPCVLPYNYILKIETLSDDLRFLVQKLSIKEVDADLKQNVSDKKESSYEEYFKDIPKQIVKEVYDLYKDDFYLFDFEIPFFFKNSEA